MHLAGFVDLGGFFQPEPFRDTLIPSLAAAAQLLAWEPCCEPRKDPQDGLGWKDPGTHPHPIPHLPSLPQSQPCLSTGLFEDNVGFVSLQESLELSLGWAGLSKPRIKSSLRVSVAIRGHGHSQPSRRALTRLDNGLLLAFSGVQFSKLGVFRYLAL